MPPASSLARGRAPYLTLPNVISAARLLAAPVLLVFASRGYDTVFLATAVLLLLTDWVDGRIARAWNQTSVFGARLDAFSDATIYACVAAGVWIMAPEVFSREAVGLAAVLGSYVLSLLVCLAKFRCLPNYHTRLSKLSWFLVTVGIVFLVLDWSPWPLRVALAVVTAANLESIAVTFLLRRWRTDVPSLFDAWRHPQSVERHPHGVERSDSAAPPG